MLASARFVARLQTTDESKARAPRILQLEIDGSEPADVLVVAFRALKWIMQTEHTVGEELKEEAERLAVEAAESGEVWDQEREIFKEVGAMFLYKIVSILIFTYFFFHYLIKLLKSNLF